MHSPEVLAFSVNRPWPRSYKMGNGKQRRYWPSVIDVWHIDPSGDHLNTCGKKHWRWHVWHWQVQVIPLRTLRRRLLTRCAWCGGHSRKGRDAVNVSHSWDGEPSRWWQGERGLYHPDCSSVMSAHRTCTCIDPLLEHNGWGTCAVCGRFRSFGQSQKWRANAQQLREAVAAGQRDPDDYQAIVDRNAELFND